MPLPLRSALLGAKEGLVSTTLLMMGIGDLKKDETAMILYGFIGLVAGACNIGIREFIAVYLDIEVAQMNSPMQAAAVSAHAFFISGMVPLLTAAFIKTHKVVGVVISVTLALILFGGLRAKLGRKPIGRCCLMVMAEDKYNISMRTERGVCFTSVATLDRMSVLSYKRQYVEMIDLVI
ncbi:vacuolar iron transporter homolog 2-like [Magnolia sinica]|uniref:vacuolar iron transporter homolog 2-like n=1 Tax=Magnolia sinica TaxID=86752 RepID=UPI00265A0182|nr:vacuolar iron transporter homolog 2-like [Magnolia sinica]